MLTVGINDKTKYTRLVATMIAAGMRMAKVGLISMVAGHKGRYRCLPKLVTL